MTHFEINREKTTEQSSVTKFVKSYDSFEEAMDDLYRQAKRHGYKVAIDDNSCPELFGFCLWQIHVQVGSWRYYVSASYDSDDDLPY